MTTALRDHLHAIRDEAGALTPRIVLEVARDPEHPLHNRFEWDDSIAGQKYRLAQARELIRMAVEFVDAPAGPVKVRSFHSVNRVDGPTYEPIAEVRADPFMSKLVLQAAEREWKTLYQKYSHLAEFLAAVRKDVAS